MNYRTKPSLGNCTPTSCPKAGIKIHESDNDYRSNPFQNNNNNNNNNNYNNNYNKINQTSHNFGTKPSQLIKPVNFYNTTLNTLDLELDHYSLEDLYRLFNIEEELSEQGLKDAKQIVLKMHPDKSRLDAKYFLFFSKAYKRLFSIYEFQNKSLKKQYKDEDFYDESNRNILDNMFDKNKDFKDPKNFNQWFNNSFEKHRIQNPNEDGYGDWLKGNEGMIDVSENVTKGNMNEIFEQKKKQIQAVTVYNGISDIYASSLGGSLLGDQGSYTTNSYTDLRQAYTETLIPVTQEDYDKMPKFRNLNEYKMKRDQSSNVTPLTKEESERILLQQKNSLDQQSAALAFKYAQEAEKAKQKQQSFWGDIKQLTGF
jgi:hypothetical protein